jgi:hypothetical protein
MKCAEKEKVKKLKDEKWNWKNLVIKKDWIKKTFWGVIGSLPLILCYFLSGIHYYDVWLTIKALVVLIVDDKVVIRIIGDRFGQ